VPVWTGQPLAGQSILLLSEQGFGDTIQFARYAQELNRGGATVRLLAPESLVEILAAMPGIEQVVSSIADAPSCDWQAPLLSLPALHNGDIPSKVPYLFPDPDRIEYWTSVLQAPQGHLRVGIAWRGGPDHRNDRNRSIDPALLRALANVHATTFISLQKGQPHGLPDLPFAPLHRDLTDFADTAALMFHLDLVISVDTSVAHLAGALGRRTWVLLPFNPDWRWMLNREDSPWYPGMRLFRQKQRGKWLPVMDRVRHELSALAKQNPVSVPGR
ncbi:MAG TPA: glycosyltransferase family 9 protein, partial [Bryobacteraceae bacterium]|nr:glycosyltransferase family 9 protein [Bryobacteraceae bacterium]